LLKILKQNNNNKNERFSCLSVLGFQFLDGQHNLRSKLLLILKLSWDWPKTNIHTIIFFQPNNCSWMEHLCWRESTSCLHRRTETTSPRMLLSCSGYWELSAPWWASVHWFLWLHLGSNEHWCNSSWYFWALCWSLHSSCLARATFLWMV